MSGEELRAAWYPLGEFDASKWADEFDRIFPDARPDRDTMLGWFANAIMTGYDHAKREEQLDIALRPAPSTEPALDVEAVAHALHYAVTGQRALGDRPDLFRASAQRFVEEYVARLAESQPSEETR